MSEPRWLDGEEQRAWRRLTAVMALLPAALDAQLQRDGSLTHFAYFVLAMLSEAPGRALRMSELASRSRSSPSRLSHTISRLEERGFVRRQRSSVDRRGQVAELTDKGLAAIVATAPGHVTAVRHYVFDVIDNDQIEQIREICDAILARIDPDGSLRASLP